MLGGWLGSLTPGIPGSSLEKKLLIIWTLNLVSKLFNEGNVNGDCDATVYCITIKFVYVQSIPYRPTYFFNIFIHE